MEILRCEKLTKRYGSGAGEVTALNGIDLSVEKGEFVALLGHNGCGKSTLAKHFNAMLLPTSGKVFVDGMDTTEEALKYGLIDQVIAKH